MARTSKYATVQQEHVQNVLAVFHRATPENVLAGQQWYPNVGQIVLAYGALYGLSAWQASSIYAILSPKNWTERNMSDFKIIARTKDFVGTEWVRGDWKVKIRRILSGEQFDTGQKTSNFAAALRGDMSHATIDRHMASIVFGIIMDGVSKDQYKYAVRVMQEAASIVGIAPGILQAITWVQWRSEKLAAAVSRGDNMHAYALSR